MTCCFFENSCKATGTSATDGSKLLQRGVFCRVRDNIILNFMNKWIKMSPVIQVNGLLAISVVSTQINNHFARNLSGQYGTMMLFENREAHINP